MNTFVIADTHLGHADIILHCKRPWCLPNPGYDSSKPFNFRNNNPLMVTNDSLQAHNQALVDGWNGIVSKKDRVIIIGDFAFSDHAKWASRLHGKKVLIRGNHDDMSQDALRHFSEVFDFGCVKSIGTGKIYPDGKSVKEKVTFCHYAMRSWEDSWDETASLHGHSHGRMPELDNLLSFDVGVDVWGYIPIPWEAVQKKIEIKRALMKSRYESDDGEASPRIAYSFDPEKRMTAIREKNFAILKSVGIDIGTNSVAIAKECVKAVERRVKADKLVSSIVAVADTVNSHGVTYSREALRRIADNKTFFWDEASGRLSIRVRSGVIGNHDAVVEMCKGRIAEAGMTIWTSNDDQTVRGS